MMKNVSYVVAIVLLFLVSCTQKSYKIGAAGNREASFENAQTYSFASQVDSELDPGLYFLNDLALKAMVRDAVEHELAARGYEKVAANPDMVVNFRVFDKPTEVTGLAGLGDDYWGGTPYWTGDPYWVGYPVVGWDDRETVQLKEGSIMVHLLDRKTGKVVWQGYASGIMDGNVLDKDKEKVAETVSLLFDRFDNRADNL